MRKIKSLPQVLEDKVQVNAKVEDGMKKAMMNDDNDDDNYDIDDMGELAEDPLDAGLIIHLEYILQNVRE